MKVTARAWEKSIIYHLSVPYTEYMCELGCVHMALLTICP